MPSSNLGYVDDLMRNPLFETHFISKCRMKTKGVTNRPNLNSCEEFHPAHDLVKGFDLVVIVLFIKDQILGTIF